MPKFTIKTGTAQGKTWKAVGTNPKTGRPMTIQGGQKGVAVGPKARGMTPKKYVNKLRWNGKAKIGSSVNIPKNLF